MPIVQLSLYGNEDPEKHYRLGQALESLRDESVLIVGAGMAVHNLHDYRKSKGSGAVMPYVSLALAWLNGGGWLRESAVVLLLMNDQPT